MSDIDASVTRDDLNRLELEAGIARTRAEERKFLGEAMVAELQAEKERIYLEALRHKHLRDLASNEHHLFYAFNGEVTPESVSKCIDQLTIWMRVHQGEPIEIQFNSPGGSVVDGMALYDFIQTVRAAGHFVTTSTIGYAASMAGILLQAGDHRVMGEYASILIHEISFGAAGKMGEIEDRTEWLKAIWEKVIGIFEKRSNMTRRQLMTLSSRKDAWILSDDALKKGLVDEIR